MQTSKVFVRLSDENGGGSEGDRETLAITTDSSFELNCPSNAGTQSYRRDCSRVFTKVATQHSIYKKSVGEHLNAHSTRGGVVVVGALGVGSLGRKAGMHTLFGKEQNEGIVPRAAHTLMNGSGECGVWSCTFALVCGDGTRTDLLNPDSEPRQQSPSDLEHEVHGLSGLVSLVDSGLETLSRLRGSSSPSCDVVVMCLTRSADGAEPFKMIFVQEIVSSASDLPTSWLSLFDSGAVHRVAQCAGVESLEFSSKFLFIHSGSGTGLDEVSVGMLKHFTWESAVLPSPFDDANCVLAVEPSLDTKSSGMHDHTQTEGDPMSAGKSLDHDQSNLAGHGQHEDDVAWSAAGAYAESVQVQQMYFEQAKIMDELHALQEEVKSLKENERALIERMEADRERALEAQRAEMALQHDAEIAQLRSEVAKLKHEKAAALRRSNIVQNENVPPTTPPQKQSFLNLLRRNPSEPVEVGNAVVEPGDKPAPTNDMMSGYMYLFALRNNS